MNPAAGSDCGKVPASARFLMRGVTLQPLRDLGRGNQTSTIHSTLDLASCTNTIVTRNCAESASAVRACVPFCGECARTNARHSRVVANSSDLTGCPWSFLEPLLLISPNEDRKRRRPTPSRRCMSTFAPGCQWRFLPWSSAPGQSVVPIRRWSKNGTWSRVLTALHARRARARPKDRDPRMSLSTRTSLAGLRTEV